MVNLRSCGRGPRIGWQELVSSGRAIRGSCRVLRVRLAVRRRCNGRSLDPATVVDSCGCCAATARSSPSGTAAANEENGNPKLSVLKLLLLQRNLLPQRSERALPLTSEPARGASTSPATHCAQNLPRCLRLPTEGEQTPSDRHRVFALRGDLRAAYRQITHHAGKVGGARY